MANETKRSIDKEYLLRTLRHFAGKELYDDITDTKIISYSNSSIVTNYEKSAVAAAAYVYTGKYECAAVVDATNIATYTAMGLTVAVGDKIRNTIRITDDNLPEYNVYVPGIEVGDYINPVNPTTDIADTRYVSDDPASPVNVDFLNAYYFITNKVEVGDLVTFTDDKTETTTVLKSLIKDLYEKKLTIEETTLLKYKELEHARALKDNVLYIVLNAPEPTAWLRGNNIFGGGGGIDTVGAQDGDFLVFSQAQNKPVWKGILDAMTMGW